jgi:hypothetical protein
MEMYWDKKDKSTRHTPVVPRTKFPFRLTNTLIKEIREHRQHQRDGHQLQKDLHWRDNKQFKSDGKARSKQPEVHIFEFRIQHNDPSKEYERKHTQDRNDPYEIVHPWWQQKWFIFLFRRFTISTFFSRRRRNDGHRRWFNKR